MGQLHTHKGSKVIGNPVIVSTVVYFSIIFSAAVFSLYNGAFFFVKSGHYDPLEDNEETRMALEVGTFTTIALLPITIMIAKYAAHRIKSGAWVWVPSAVFLSRMTMFALGVLLLPDVIDRNAVVVTSGGAFFHLVAALVGVAWGNKTQDEYFVRKVFRHLSTTERQAMLELIRTNPRRWKVTKRAHRR